MGMSESEHLDTSPAYFKEINRSVDCGVNAKIEPSSNEERLIHSENGKSVPSVYLGSSVERKPYYENNVIRKSNDDGENVMNWDGGECLGDFLNTTQTEGGGLNMLDNKVQDFEIDGRGDRISNCNAAYQPGDCLDPANSTLEKLNVLGEDSLTSKPAEDAARTSICGYEETLGIILDSIGAVDEELYKDDDEDCSAEGNIVEGLSEYNYGNQVADLPNKSVQTSNVVFQCISSQGTHNENFMKGNDGTQNDEQKAKTASRVAHDDMKTEQTAKFNVGVIKSSPTDGAKRSLAGEMEKTHQGMWESSRGIGKHKFTASDVNDCLIERAGPHSGKPLVVVLGCPAGASENSMLGQRQSKVSTASPGKKHAQRSSADSTRSLRPRSRQTSQVPEPSSKTKNKSNSSVKGRGRKKKMEIEGKSYDEFLRIRKHLRYLLHRIHYEQNLLDAYSSEGWRGQSLEKLRPEKELERAKADINRSKLKIRNLFQHLDSLSADGKFPDSLFDSEGLIDSEDIYCAKCGSDDLFADNDIILCDGACDRGFHQFCLEPPLRTEEIPPGDEGWLCPACDCKVDCMDLLNDSQGTKLSVGDCWEKVFPEVVASLAGNEHDNLMGLPSDDSDDNDYNPEGADDDVKAVEDGSNSDGSDSSESDSSDFSSASEDLEAVVGGQQYLGLPSDDSEDDDFDPDGGNDDQDVERESSSSDFTSASEDLGAAVRNDGISGDDEPPTPLLEPDQDPDYSTPVSGRRNVERLDYEKLYNETYGKASSDSSDDEEWTGKVSACKRKGSTAKVVSNSSNVKASASADGSCSAGASQRRGRKKLNPQATTNGSPAPLVKSSEKTSSDKPLNRIGEAATRRLYESFRENHYPDRITKEKLAEELGLTPKRVDKWFGNARWSFNHRPERLEASMAAVSGDANAALSGSVDVTESGKKSKPTPKTSRKRENREECQPVISQNSDVETSKEGAQNDSTQSPQAKLDPMQSPVVQHGRQKKRRKSST